MSKRCPRCGEDKPLDQFNKSHKRSGGLASWCKTCTVDARRESRAKESPDGGGLLPAPLGWAPQWLEEKVAQEGLCGKHEHPEWWTMDAPTSITVDTPVEVVRVVGGGREWRTTGTRSAAWHARQVCAQCPVRRDCRRLVDMIEAPFPYSRGHLSGIWAGESGQERVNRRSAARAAA